MLLVQFGNALNIGSEQVVYREVPYILISERLTSHHFGVRNQVLRDYRPRSSIPSGDLPAFLIFGSSQAAENLEKLKPAQIPIRIVLLLHELHISSNKHTINSGHIARAIVWYFPLVTEVSEVDPRNRWIGRESNTAIKNVFDLCYVLRQCLN